MLITLAAVACSLGAFRFWRRQSIALERRYWVFRCCHYTAPKNQVAKGENEFWLKLSDECPLSDDSTVFCHELTAPNGLRRLVFLDAHRSAYRESHRVPLTVPPTHHVSFACWIWDPAVLRENGDSDHASRGDLIGPWTIGDGWRFDFLNGEPDPDDRSHFSFGYKLDDMRGTIDGWLCDDGAVKLKIRDGPATPY